jgi:hypothetical protein
MRYSLCWTQKHRGGGLTEMKFLMVKSSVREATFSSWPLSCARRDIISSSAESRMASVLTVGAVRIGKGMKSRDLPVIGLVWPIRWTRCWLSKSSTKQNTKGLQSEWSNPMIVTLTACASTSALHTGSQNMTRDAEVRFLRRFQIRKARAWARECGTHRPREPCFNSMRNTLYLSDVSKVVTYCWRMCTGEAVVY